MGRCEMQIGSLVSHPCGRNAKATCTACGRQLCGRHMSAAMATCVQCAEEYTPPEAPVSVSMEEMFRFSDKEAALFDTPGSGTGQPYDS